MAISNRAVGSWAFAASGSSTAVTLPTHAAGDMLIVRIASKSASILNMGYSTSSEGWYRTSGPDISGFIGGSANSGNGTGSICLVSFWKIATSSSESNPTIDFTAATTQSGFVALSYQKAATEEWLMPAGEGGWDSTSGTSHSATTQTHLSVVSGDMVDFFTGIADDTTMTVPTITQTGVTFNTVTEAPATAGLDTSGADGAYDGGYRLATAGTSSAAAVVTGTLSTSETGSSYVTRLRVGNRVPYFTSMPQLIPH